MGRSRDGRRKRPKRIEPEALYGDMFCIVAERFGWTFEQIGEMTHKQFQSVLSYLEKYPVSSTRMLG